MTHPETGVPRTPRTNMFVMATIYADTGSAPVTIRNLSSGGALIEGGVIPRPGTKIRLARGDLMTSGQVLWSKGAKAGLQFDADVIVADWLPNARPRSQQDKVDAIVYKFDIARPGAATEMSGSRGEQIDAKEILRVKACLEALAEELADDADLIARHGSKLQILDIAAQLFGKLSLRSP